MPAPTHSRGEIVQTWRTERADSTLLARARRSQARRSTCPVHGHVPRSATAVGIAPIGTGVHSIAQSDWGGKMDYLPPVLIQRSSPGSDVTCQHRSDKGLVLAEDVAPYPCVARAKTRDLRNSCGGKAHSVSITQDTGFRMIQHTLESQRLSVRARCRSHTTPSLGLTEHCSQSYHTLTHPDISLLQKLTHKGQRQVDAV
jgi:hypothetical protein